MGWARVDDGFHDHRKVVELDLETVGLWTLCLTWAHRDRRTSPTPGLVPFSVVRRFAGGRAKRLAGRLAAAGMWDEEPAGGWRIHDFADYLAKYDADQARAAGSAGGKAKAAKQTASKPLQAPPSEPVADRNEVSSTRASARRNPVPNPKPKEPRFLSDLDGGTSVTRGPTGSIGQIVAAWSHSATKHLGMTPISNMTTNVADRAREMLTTEPFEDVLAAAAKAGRKGFVTIDEELIRMRREAAAVKSKFHDDKGNPSHSPPPANDPFANLPPGALT